MRLHRRRDCARTLSPALTATLLLAVGADGARAASGPPAGWEDSCRVVWTSPSRDASGSMPIGNGDLAANLWVEEGGDIHFLLAGSGTWSETGRLLKLGRLRLRVEPNPFLPGAPFRQALRLQEGEVEIEVGSPASRVLVRAWIDARDPALRIEVESRRPVRLRAVVENWRERERVLSGRELFSAHGIGEPGFPPAESPDRFLAGRDHRIVWYHRNAASIWGHTLAPHGLQEWARRSRDPLLHRTFGAAVSGPGMRREGERGLRGGTGTRHRLTLHAHTAQTSTAEEWLRGLDQAARRAEDSGLEDARAAHRRWWREFWSRSWILVSGSPEAGRVTRGYALQRYLLACAGRGTHPILPNGSLFTTGGPDGGEPFNPDYRRWGGLYRLRSASLPYRALLASGDPDLAEPFFRMYRDALPLLREQSRLRLGHPGVALPGAMFFWGATPPAPERGSAGLELISLLLDARSHSGGSALQSSLLVPLADEVLAFYGHHYRRSADSSLDLFPAPVLETFRGARDPAPDTAGLRAVLPRLLALSGLGSERRAAWENLLRQAPPLPRGTEERLLAADALREPPYGSENPELHAVWPFGLFGTGRPGLEAARRSFDARRFRGQEGWRLDDIQAACLGLADEARDRLVTRLSPPGPEHRFPAFWGPGLDWTPDQAHGGAGMLALQAMLLQWDGERIHLLPAWPAEWHVAFRLHAPEGTILEGEHGPEGWRSLEISPAGRARNVVRHLPRGR